MMDSATMNELPRIEGYRSDLTLEEISAPTPIINLFQRIFTCSEAEYELLHKLQDTIRLVPVAQWGSSKVEYPPAEAIYCFAMRDGEDTALNGSHKYTLTFPNGQIPQLHPFGFWSLTMYNESFLLVDNPIDSYLIRPDQACLTYDLDGSLTLYLQADKPASVPEGNWLPSPTGLFSVALRTYLPQEVILDGTWFPSGIEKVDKLEILC